MPIIQFPEKELLRDKIVAPAWYTLLIETMGEWTVSKKGDSYNMTADGTIVCNADTGSVEFAGVPIGGPGVWQFNTKVLSFLKGFVFAMAEQCGYDAATITKATQIEGKVFEGKYVDVFVENSVTPDGRTKNKVTHKYRMTKFQA